MAEPDFTTHSSGALSPAMFDDVERLRANAQTVVQRLEVYRLQAIATRLRDLELLGEQILSSVMAGLTASAATDPPEIPDFLRRY